VRAAVIATAVTAACVVIAVFVPGKADIAGIVWAPVWAVGSWRAWHRGLRVGDSGVTVVGLLVSRRIAWSDIEEFALLPAGRYPIVGHVVRTRGRAAVPIMGIIGSRGRPQTAQRQIDELNDQLSTRRQETVEREQGLADAPAAARPPHEPG
jgi:Bacterial PH domain